MFGYDPRQREMETFVRDDPNSEQARKDASARLRSAPLMLVAVPVLALIMALALYVTR